MNQFFSSKYVSRYLLFLILIVSTALRFYALSFQSMWVDELHTMREADPTISWGMMFDYLKCCDQHPPLYFIAERLLFSIFGHTEFIARSLSVLCGVGGVAAMYVLGKEIFSKDLGLIAAALMSINFYSIQYSQEARCYIMALLFTILSYVYLIRLVRELSIKHMFLYALFSLLMLYSHYYGLFIGVSQAMVIVVFYFQEKHNKKQFLKLFALAGGIILLGYLPWIPFVIAMSEIKSFWIGTIGQDFFIVYFYDYFGGSDLLKPFLLLFLLYYCFQVFAQHNTLTANVKESPLQLSFFIFFVGVAITYLIPYLRSVLVVPMLFNRYTIVVLPAFILALSFGITLISHRLIRMTMLLTFVILSLTDLIFVKKYYSIVRKTQFRELTAFIKEEPEKYPIVEEKTSWQHEYYLQQADYHVPLLAGNKEATVDSILVNKGTQYKLEGFWLVGAHGYEPSLAPEVQRNLDTAFNMIKAKTFFDAWAQLYIRKSGVSLVPAYFPNKMANFYNAEVIPMWGGAVTSEPVKLTAGKYVMAIVAMGTPALNVYPHFTIYANDRKVGEITTLESFGYQRVFFELEHDETINFKIDLDNDLMDSATGQDRNAFIQNILVNKQK